MKFFNRLFGKEPDVPFPIPIDEDEEIQLTGSQPIQGPPEFVRAVELQQAYWMRNVEEQSQLEARGVEGLSWRERLRLHHLTCLQRIYSGSERATATEKCRQSVRRLIAFDSPYRPRVAMIWQGQSSNRDPDMLGNFLNASLTHIGCLEIYRVDAANLPTEIDFVSFDDLCGVGFAPPNLIRTAKLLYDDGSDEIVLVPMLYGVTWAIGKEDDRAGRRPGSLRTCTMRKPVSLGRPGLAWASRTSPSATKTKAVVCSALGPWPRFPSRSTLVIRNSTRRRAPVASTRTRFVVNRRGGGERRFSVSNLLRRTAWQ